MKATHLIFRRPTSNDFRNINSTGYVRGGGQSYIDVTTAGVSPQEWTDFFAGTQALLGHRAAGDTWTFEVQSIGLGLPQVLKVARRRPASYCFTEQKLQGRRADRVFAWRPDLSAFPDAPAGITSATDPRIPPLIANLCVYVLRAENGTFWAGMLGRVRGVADRIDPRLVPLFAGDPDGYIDFGTALRFDPTDPEWIFSSTNRARQRLRYVAPPVLPGALGEFAGDVDAGGPAMTPHTVRIVQRNRRAVAALKQLYGECQITGALQTFPTTKGDPYLEVHHLVPLGKGGADHPRNMIVVSAQMHRMLHYADVDPIDPQLMLNGTLSLTINGDPYTITWHPGHADLVTNA